MNYCLKKRHQQYRNKSSRTFTLQKGMYQKSTPIAMLNNEYLEALPLKAGMEETKFLLF